MPSKTEPELEVKFFNRLGHYLPLVPLEKEAAKARELIGHREIRRMDDRRYLVATSPGSPEPYYLVDIAELHCSCPPVRLHKVTACKHLILCQWVEDALNP